jgi:sigma-B regulation protein RsbU (phosphoserine phosphatase)
VRILVADDDLLIRRILEKILAKSGHEVVPAASGSEAWQILSGQDPPALAILDWMMPQMTGVEVCRKVREAGGSAPTYLVVLTSRGQTDDLVTAFEAGADDYITKPFEAEELRARVSVGVRMITLQQQLADRILALEESLAHVQQLQGLIPICAWCRQVRSDGNFWEKVESYLGKRSGLQFTHAICPTCKTKQTEGLKRLRPA